MSLTLSKIEHTRCINKQDKLSGMIDFKFGKTFF